MLCKVYIVRNNYVYNNIYKRYSDIANTIDKMKSIATAFKDIDEQRTKTQYNRIKP